MTEPAAAVSGRRRAVHRVPPGPSCGVRPPAEPLTADQLAQIASEDPRRLCARCYPTRDRR